jgi:hypothetical protein
MNLQPTQTFSPSEAALSVFGLIKRQPQFVLRYVAIYAGLTYLSTLAAAALGLFGDMAKLQSFGAPGANPSPEEAMAMLGEINWGGIAISIVLFLLVYVVLTAAALRKTVRDSEEGVLGLKISGDELALLLASLVVFGLFFSVTFLASVVGGLLGTIAAPLSIVGLVVATLAALAIAVLLSQYGVLTIVNGRSSALASVNETKPYFWRFMGSHLLWIVIATIIGIVVQSILTLLVAGLGTKTGAGYPADLAAALSPGWIVFLLGSGLIQGLSALGSVCVGAYAWHQMHGGLPAPKASEPLL